MQFTFANMSLERLDDLIWRQGFANARYASNPSELDFLRDVHSPRSVFLLRHGLRVWWGVPVRVSSYWQDKYGWVKTDPRAPGVSKLYERQELTYLAFVISKVGIDGTNILYDCSCFKPSASFPVWSTICAPSSQWRTVAQCRHWA